MTIEALHVAPDLERRFGGLQRLYGRAGAERIRASHVAVVGIGGVGSWAVEALARSGIGHLTLIDLDHIAESNVNRQIHAIDSTLGQAKVQAMRDRIAQINAACVVTCVEDFVQPDNWPTLLAEPVDAVIDACDQVHAKVAIAAWGLARCVNVPSAVQPIVLGVGAAGGKRQAHRVDIEDLSLVTHDPLLAQVRRRLRKEHGAAGVGQPIGLACVFSREPVVRPDTVAESSQHPAGVQILDSAGNDSTLNCHGYGSVVSVTATFGLCAAGWVLDELARQAA